MRVLKVKGTGEISQKPDLIVIRFKIVSDNYNYDEVIKDLNSRSAILRKDIVRAGFDRDDLKTTDYRIETKYRHTNSQSIFDGYKATQNFILEFDFDREVLNNLVRIIASSEANTEFNINFEVKDKESFKHRLIEQAVLNAKGIAKVIANTANIRLGKILNINYDIQDIIYRSNLMLEKSVMMAATDIDIVPEDVKSQDSVIMEWEIEDLI